MPFCEDASSGLASVPLALTYNPNRHATIDVIMMMMIVITAMVIIVMTTMTIILMSTMAIIVTARMIMHP